MNTYLILFREPDGRQDPHSPREVEQHQAKFKIWMDNLIQQNSLAGGNALSLNGKTIGLQKHGQPVTDGPYYVNGTEIVGGYLLIKASNPDDAVGIIKTCPIFNFGAFAEIREMM